MSRYWILEAVAFMDNGQPLLYNTIPKEPVEIDDDVAETLGNKVRRVDPLPEPEKVAPESVEAPISDTVDETVDEAPEPEESPKPKRKRKTEEEEPDGDKEL